MAVAPAEAFFHGGEDSDDDLDVLWASATTNVRNSSETYSNTRRMESTGSHGYNNRRTNERSSAGHERSSAGHERSSAAHEQSSAGHERSSAGHRDSHYNESSSGYRDSRYTDSSAPNKDSHYNDSRRRRRSRSRSDSRTSQSTWSRRDSPPRKKQDQHSQQRRGSSPEGTPSPQQSQLVHRAAAVNMLDKPSFRFANKSALLVADLNHSTTSHSLITYFSTFGSVFDAEVKYNTIGDTSGIVRFNTPAGITCALAKWPHVIDGRRVSVKRQDDTKIIKGADDISSDENENPPEQPSTGEAELCALESLTPELIFTFSSEPGTDNVMIGKLSLRDVSGFCRVEGKEQENEAKCKAALKLLNRLVDRKIVRRVPNTAQFEFIDGVFSAGLAMTKVIQNGGKSAPNNGGGDAVAAGNKPISTVSKVASSGDKYTAPSHKGDSTGNKAVPGSDKAISTKDQSVTTSDKTVTTCSKAVSVINKTTSTGNKSVAPSNTPVSASAKPAAASNKTVTTINKEVSGSKQTSAGGTGDAVNNKTTCTADSSGDKAVASNNKTVSAAIKPSSTATAAGSTGNHTACVNDTATAPGDTISAGDKAVSAGNKAVSASNKAVPTSNKAVSAGDKAIAAGSMAVGAGGDASRATVDGGAVADAPSRGSECHATPPEKATVAPLPASVDTHSGDEEKAVCSAWNKYGFCSSLDDPTHKKKFSHPKEALPFKSDDDFIREVWDVADTKSVSGACQDPAEIKEYDFDPQLRLIIKGFLPDVNMAALRRLICRADRITLTRQKKNAYVEADFPTAVAVERTQSRLDRSRYKGEKLHVTMPKVEDKTEVVEIPVVQKTPAPIICYEISSSSDEEDVDEVLNRLEREYLESSTDTSTTVQDKSMIPCYLCPGQTRFLQSDIKDHVASVHRDKHTSPTHPDQAENDGKVMTVDLACAPLVDKKGLYNCRMCKGSDAVFSDEASFIFHLSTRSHIYYLRKSKLLPSDIHNEPIMYGGKFLCKICSVPPFENYKSYDLHMNDMDHANVFVNIFTMKGDKYQCPLCDEAIQNQKDIWRHMRSDSHQKIVIKKCEEQNLSDVSSETDEEDDSTQDVSGMDQDVSVIDQDVSVVEQDVSAVVQDVSVVDQDVSAIDPDVSVVDQDVSIVDQDVSVVDQDVSVVDQNVSIVHQGVSVIDQDASVVDQDASVLDQDASVVDQDASVVDQDASAVDQDVSASKAGPSSADNITTTLATNRRPESPFIVSITPCSVSLKRVNMAEYTVTVPTSLTHTAVSSTAAESRTVADMDISTAATDDDDYIVLDSVSSEESNDDREPSHPEEFDIIQKSPPVEKSLMACDSPTVKDSDTALDRVGAGESTVEVGPSSVVSVSLEASIIENDQLNSTLETLIPHSTPIATPAVINIEDVEISMINSIQESINMGEESAILLDSAMQESNVLKDSSSCDLDVLISQHDPTSLTDAIDMEDVETAPEHVEGKSTTTREKSAIVVEDITDVLGVSTSGVTNSTSVLEEASSVVEESATASSVLNESDTASSVLDESATAFEEAPSMLEESTAMGDDSTSSVEEYFSLLEDSTSALEESVLLQSTSVGEGSSTLLEEFDSVLEQSISVVKECASVLEESVDIAAQPAGVVAEFAMECEESFSVLEESTSSVEEVDMEVEESTISVDSIVEKVVTAQDSPSSTTETNICKLATTSLTTSEVNVPISSSQIPSTVVAGETPACTSSTTTLNVTSAHTSVMDTSTSIAETLSSTVEVACVPKESPTPALTITTPVEIMLDTDSQREAASVSDAVCADNELHTASTAPVHAPDTFLTPVISSPVTQTEEFESESVVNVTSSDQISTTLVPSNLDDAILGGTSEISDDINSSSIADIGEPHPSSDTLSDSTVLIAENDVSKSGPECISVDLKEVTHVGSSPATMEGVAAPPTESPSENVSPEDDWPPKDVVTADDFTALRKLSIKHKEWGLPKFKFLENKEGQASRYECRMKLAAKDVVTHDVSKDAAKWRAASAMLKLLRADGLV